MSSAASPRDDSASSDSDTGDDHDTRGRGRARGHHRGRPRGRGRGRGRGATASQVTSQAAMQAAAEDDKTTISQSDMGVSVAVFKALRDFCNSYKESVIRSGTVSKNSEPLKDSLPLQEPVHGWTPELENQAKQEWETKRSEWSVRTGPEGRFHKLFKSCLSHAGCAPSDIIGVSNRLSFQVHPRAGRHAKENASYYALTDYACTKLDLLVTHPAFRTPQPGGRAAALALAIQYAVILRTNDRRPCHYTMKKPFMVDFQDRTYNGRCKREVHAELRADYERRNTFALLGSMSEIFLALERVVRTPKDILELDEDDRMYYVLVDDLTNLIKALDTMIDPDTQARLFLPAQVYNATATSIRQSDAPPKGVDVMHALHGQAMLEEQRRIIQYKLTMRSQPAAPPPASHAPDRRSPRPTSPMSLVPQPKVESQPESGGDSFPRFSDSPSHTSTAVSPETSAGPAAHGARDNASDSADHIDSKVSDADEVIEADEADDVSEASTSGPIQWRRVPATADLSAGPLNLYQDLGFSAERTSDYLLANVIRGASSRGIETVGSMMGR
ncbi:hypothetical protein NLG97_g9678 [Lecanicillium saksenae]|uniref:Uncharacterized protein n=1 Tax=Lecanicillium saksenae TaxID=468837 RepID=A0ACC1QIC5_9HYPO|nr:hypothetical protein NLG97_g9678 [Lecanicillium saksenae]